MCSATSKRIAIDVAIVVSDIDRSLSFYRDLVGLPVIAEITTSLIGTGRMVQLQHGDSLIKLLAMKQTPSQQSSADITTAFGYRYITLLVLNIELLMTKLKRHNVPVTIPLTQLDNGAAIAMVTDPDGNIVEFVTEAEG